MNDQYYSIPISFKRLIKCEPLKRVEIEKSIAQKIFLILLTHFEEYRFDYTFGCSIWEEDFELLPRINIWKEQLKRSIEDSLIDHEPRLTQLQVKINIDEIPFTHPEDENVRKIKKRITVFIDARLTKTDEPFSHAETLFLSPISVD